MKKPPLFRAGAGRRDMLAALGSFAIFALFLKKFTNSKAIRRSSTSGDTTVGCGSGSGKTARMLTRDGLLVEVDPRMARPVKKATDEELRDWIK
jgi:hypothetical protein